MSDLGKKIHFPGTRQAGDPATQRYARKLTWQLDELKAHLETVINNLILGVTDHGDLTGLDDAADHLWAFLKDGSRAFTGYGPGFSNDPLLADADPYTAVSEQAIKAYVDALLAYILASPVGTVIYIWQDFGGQKYLERLEPGEYGQVLTTGGANQRPFWAWVWEEPGGDFGGKVFFRIWMYAYAWDASIITMDKLKTVQAGGLSIIRRDDKTNPTYFTAYHPALDASVTGKSIVTMNKTKTVTASMAVSYKLTPITIVSYDTLSLSDSAAATIPLGISKSDALGLTDYTEVAIP